MEVVFKCFWINIVKELLGLKILSSHFQLKLAYKSIRNHIKRYFWIKFYDFIIFSYFSRFFYVV
jgi:hypothetical protein